MAYQKIKDLPALNAINKCLTKIYVLPKKCEERSLKACLSNYREITRRNGFHRCPALKNGPTEKEEKRRKAGIPENAYLPLSSRFDSMVLR